jgi:tRNA pseudouridine65 synthase
MNELEIIYKDEYLIAINKPHGLLVHRSFIASDVSEFAIQKLRDQIGEVVYLTHRLDRKTGGVLLFALNENCNTLMQKMFANQEVEKEYLAIVRGFSPVKGIIDYPLVNDKGKIQNAVTEYVTLKQSEVDYEIGNHPTSRYSLVKVTPKTGRMHQIRKHFAHIFHPIIADRPHGCNKQNRYFKQKFGLDTMLLHAQQISFFHPISHKKIIIKANLQFPFMEFAQKLGFKDLINF